MYIRLDVDLKNKLKMTFSWIEWPTSNKQFFINVGQNFTILKWGLECPSLDKKILGEISQFCFQCTVAWEISCLPLYFGFCCFSPPPPLDYLPIFKAVFCTHTHTHIHTHTLNVWYCSIIVRVQSLWNLSHNSKI